MQGIAKAFAKTLGVFIGADFLSNCLEHPCEKLDYGCLNKMLGRPVNEKWWGTRLEHLIGVPLGLAITHELSENLFARYLKKRGLSFSLAKTPGPMLAHLFGFCLAGIMLYGAYDAKFNPHHKKGERMKAFNNFWFPTTVGSSTLWAYPLVAAPCDKMFGTAGVGGLIAYLIPSTVAFYTVKTAGFQDWGKQGLSDYERILNKLEKPKTEEPKKTGH